MNKKVQWAELNGFKVEELPPFHPGNPFHHDKYHMGVTIGTNCTAMYEKHKDEDQPYLIIANPKTGKRIKIFFEENVKQDKRYLCGHCLTFQNNDCDEDANCGHCHHDQWVEKRDFKVGRNWVQAVAHKHGLSVNELQAKFEE